MLHHHVHASALTATITFGSAPSGGGNRLEATQFLPQPRERLFEFFADAFNLESLTPPWLRFTVLTPAPISITAGTILDYRLRLRGIPLRWQSRISVWEPPLRFVDEQVRGPYRRWHHEHAFEAVEGGTVCRDIVEYKAPGGNCIHALLVRPDLRRIFAYRQRRMAELFAPPNAPR